MNQSQLANYISEKAGIPRSKACLFLKVLISIIVLELKTKRIFRFPGFGIFTITPTSGPPPPGKSKKLIPDREEYEKRAAQLTQKARVRKPKAIVKPPSVTVETTQYCRNPEVKAWLLRNANGHCENCGSPAPFVDLYGNPYLEEHHVVPLAEGGSDGITNAVILCPNCHRRMHFGSDRHAIVKKLYVRIRRLKRRS